MNEATLEQQYYDITALYDYAEELVETVGSEQITEPENQLARIAPLVEEIGDAADVLSEAFIAIAEGKPFARRRNRSRIEKALRGVYNAIDHYTHSARNIADPIVHKIKRQLELIVAHFIGIVQLSLDKIMHKNDIEELKQRQTQIALMLHAAGQAQQA